MVSKLTSFALLCFAAAAMLMGKDRAARWLTISAVAISLIDV
jgi:hypothetical protein